MHFGYEWWRDRIEKCLDAREGCHERSRELGVRRRANDEEHSNPIGHHGVALIDLVPYSLVVREHEPSLRANGWQPLVVRSIRREVIAMLLNKNPRLPKDGGETLAQVAIGEEDPAHAARS